MIATLLLALQLLAPSVLVVQRGTREVTVPVVQTNTGLALRPDLFTPLLGGSVRRGATGRYVLEIDGVRVDLTDQVPFARIDSAVIPLAGAPFTSDGHLFVPLQLVVDVLPRYSHHLAWDPDRSVLRAIGELAAAPPDSAAVTGAFAGAGSPTLPAAAGSQPAPRAAAPAPAPAPRATATTSHPSSPARRRRVIVVDAGHGGVDPGMKGPIGHGPRIEEKDITLQVALRLGKLLERRGYDVVYTRTTDTLIALSDRGRIANDHHGDLFISVHVNAANPNWRDPGAARGVETYFLAEAKTEDAKRVEAMENEAVRFETGAYAPKGDPLSFVITDMAQNEHLRESSDLAATIQEQLAKIAPGPDRGVRQANFAVLRGSYMPAVLVEIGFGTNPADARYISSRTGQQAIARAIADATDEYLAGYEQRVGAAQP